MFGDINRSLKPRQVKIFLCKPDMGTIAKLNDSYNIKLTTRLADLNEVSFSVPYQVDIRGQLERNPKIDLIRDRYILKVVEGLKEEYFIITEMKDSGEDSGESREVKAWSLGYELRDKMIRNYKNVGITAKQAMADALYGTIWKIGANLSDELHHFNKTGRSFDVPSKTVLDFIQEIAESFKAVIVWNTKTRTVDFELKENIGQNKGLKMSYGKYLQSIGRESNTDEMVTRLTPFGQDELTVHSYNPTGSGYIEDFSYFMHPFERDANKNVLSSSHYMSDSLCNAIIDYNDLVASKEGEFSTLLSSKLNKESEKSQMEEDLYYLGEDLALVQDRIETKKSMETYHYSTFTTTGSSTVELDSDKKYGVLAHSDLDVTITVDGVSQTLPANTYTLVSKLGGDPNVSDTFSTTIGITGTANVEVETLNITLDEYNGYYTYIDSNNVEQTVQITDQEIVDKYSEGLAQYNYDAKLAQINAKQDEINAIQVDIDNLAKLLDVNNNFTAEQLVERNQFIIEKEWSNTNIYEAGTLYEEAKKHFEKIRKPQVVIDIDIINFLEVVDAQKDWDKLVLGDEITIEYETLGVSVTAKIIEIDYDIEGRGISIKIANVKDIETDEDKFINTLYGAVSTSKTVDMSKYKWDDINETKQKVNNIIDNAWDATKQKIVAGTNESVQISRRGIMITNPDDKDKYLVANHAVLAITRSGGKTWEHAITTDGIIGERIIGKIFIGENLLIENSGGTFKVDKHGVTVSGTSFNVVGSDNLNTNLDTRLTDAQKNAELYAKDYYDTNIVAVNNEIAQLDTAVNDATGYIHTTFRDGVIDDSEKLAIKEHLKRLDNEKSDVDRRYADIYNNAYLKDDSTTVTTKTDLYNAKTDFDAKHTDLVNAINTAIADASIIDDERANVESKSTAYGTSLGSLSTAFEKAIDYISEARKDEAISYTDTQISEVNSTTTALGQSIDDMSSDLKVTRAEAESLEIQLAQVNKESTDVVAIATGLGITTEKTAYESALSDLTTYLGSFINQASYPIDITATQRTDIKTKFETVQDKKSVLINKINSVTDSNTRGYVAGEVNELNKSITQLQSDVGEFSSDGKISLPEANTLELGMSQVVEESKDIIAVADSLVTQSSGSASLNDVGVQTARDNYKTALANLEDEIQDWTTWEFVQPWDSQPYSTSATTVNSVTGGILNVTSTSNDPYISMYNIGKFNPNTFRYIEIKYRVVSGNAGNAEIFFTNTHHTTATTGYTVNGSLVSDGVWNTLVIDMWSHAEWKTGGYITGWRYDWATNSSVNMEIDYIKLKKAEYPLDITLTNRDNIELVFDNVQDTKSKLVNKISEQRDNVLNINVQAELDDVWYDLKDVAGYINTSFHDGVISEAESINIAGYLKGLNSEKSDVDSKYTEVYNNTYLKDSTIKSGLNTAYNNFVTSHNNLTSSINTAITDGSVTQAEKDDVDAKFVDYESKLGSLSTAFENATDNITKNKSDEALGRAKMQDPYFEDGKFFWSTSYEGEIVPETEIGTIVGGTGSKGGKVWEIGTGTSNWVYYRYAFPVDVNRTYRMKFRIRQTVDPTLGGSNVYAGVATLDSSYNNITGGSGTHRYFAVSAHTLTATQGWVEFEGTISGVGDAHNQFRLGTAYVRPMFIVNYSGGNGTAQVDYLEFEDITETLDGKDAWSKFTGVSNTLPSGNVEFNFADSTGKGGNAKNTDSVGNQTATNVQNATINFNGRNDRDGSPISNPVLAIDGTAVDHTVNTDGSVNISFEWAGVPESIDGYIVYVMQSNSNASYTFGASTNSESVYYVTPDREAIFIHGVPSNKYYTFGVQAYRIVDEDVKLDGTTTLAGGVVKSGIVQSTITEENPYLPSSTVAFSGNITGTIGAGKTSADTIEARANGSLQEGQLYNNVTIDTTSGLVATLSNNKRKTIVNATDGLKIQGLNSSGVWENRFWADATTGIVYANGLVISSDDGTSVMIDAKQKKIDLSAFTTIAGSLKANNVTVGSTTSFESGYNPYTNSLKTGNLINNTTISGNLNRWTAHPEFTVVNKAFQGVTVPVQQIYTSGDVIVQTDEIEIDPSKSYEITFWFSSNGSTGTDYFGLYAYNGAGTNIGIDLYNISNLTFSSANTNPYFWYGDNPSGWVKRTAYIMPSGTDSSEFSNLGENVLNSARFLPNTKKIRLRWLNYYNNGKLKYTWVANPKIVEVGADLKRISDQTSTNMSNQVRTDLNLTSPVDSNIIEINSNGITASEVNSTGTKTGNYARLDNRGLYVYNGALQIDTGASGVNINATDGIKVTNTTNTVQINATSGINILKGTSSVFSINADGDLDITGNITMAGGSISWSAVNAPAWGSIANDGNKPADGADVTTYVLQLNKSDGTHRGIKYNATTDEFELDIGKVKAGTIDASRINGGTITASISMESAKIKTQETDLGKYIELGNPSEVQPTIRFYGSGSHLITTGGASLIIGTGSTTSGNLHLRAGYKVIFDEGAVDFTNATSVTWGTHAPVAIFG